MTLRGRILALSGAPLAKAVVTLLQMAFPHRPHPKTATTGPDGTFEIDDVEPGQYQLGAERTGYVSASLAGPLTVAPDRPLDAIELELIPQAVVTGRVLDEDGEPLEQARVVLVPAKPQVPQPRFMLRPRQLQQTNDLGEFRLAGIAPGSYFLQAAVETPGYPTVNWPDAPIEVAIGARLGGFDITMRKVRGYRVRGRVEWPPDTHPGSRRVALHPSGAMRMGRIGPPEPATETIDYTSVLPGTYMLAAMCDGRQAQMHIQVTDHDLDGLVLTFHQGSAIEGVVRGVDSPGELRFGLGGPVSAQPVMREDGSFTLHHVVSGTYRLYFFPIPGDGYVKRVLYGGVEMPPEAIDMSAPASLEIELAFDSAVVAGAVDPPRPGTMIQLWKGDLAVHVAAADQDGRFEIRGVAPGEYRATANQQNAVPVKAAPGERVTLTLKLQ
jgi:hypothetical protein